MLTSQKSAPAARAGPSVAAVEWWSPKAWYAAAPAAAASANVAALKSARCGRDRRRRAWTTAARIPATIAAPTPKVKPTASRPTPATLIDPRP